MKIIMRFYEFKTIQNIKPLNPSQVHKARLKHQKERAGKVLKAEKGRRKQ
jgi:hypothetical protein